MTDAPDVFTSLERKNTNSEIHPQIFQILKSEMMKLSKSTKADIQILLGKNKVEGDKILKELSKCLVEILIQNGRVIDSEKLSEMVFQNLQPIYQSESEQFFKLEYNLLKGINEILEERITYILGMYLYQDCMLEMELLVNQFRMGVSNTERNIDMDKKLESLTYYLATTYQLHTDIKLYMEVKRIIENYKNKLNDTLLLSLSELQADHFNFVCRSKEEICGKLQEYQLKQYENLVETYELTEKQLS